MLKKHIILSYQEKEEKIHIPNNYDELKLLFSNKFKIEEPKNLKFTLKYI